MGNGSEVIHCFIRDHAPEAARVLERFSLEELVSFCTSIPTELTSLLFEAMESGRAADCLERMDAASAASALAALQLERAALLLRRVDPEGREAILRLLPADFGRHLALLLRSPDDSAGALMEPRGFTLPPDVSVAEALARVQANPDYASYCLYVVARDQTLVGVLNLRELLAGRQEVQVASLMHRDVVCLHMEDSLASVLAHPAWLDFHTLPVLDENSLFAGTLRHKTLRRLARCLESRGQVDQAGTALGELYRIGLAALVKGAIGADSPNSAIADAKG